MKTVLAVAAALCLLPAAARACPCGEDTAHHAQAKAPGTPAPPAPLPEGQGRVTIPISGMHCDHCVSRVKTALGRVEGVKTVDASLESGRAIVFFEKGKVDTSKLVDAVNALGYKAGTPLQN